MLVSRKYFGRDWILVAFVIASFLLVYGVYLFSSPEFHPIKIFPTAVFTESTLETHLPDVVWIGPIYSGSGYGTGLLIFYLFFFSIFANVLFFCCVITSRIDGVRACFIKSDNGSSCTWRRQLPPGLCEWSRL